MKKNLLTVLILALLVVNIVLTSVLMFSVMGTNKKTAELVSNIATVMNLELTVPGQEGVAEMISLEDTDVHNLTNSLTIPLAGEQNGEEGAQRYIMFKLALSMNMEHEDYEKYGETIAERESLIEDTVRSTVNAYTESDCRNEFDKVQAEILKAIQNLFQSDFIYNIAITDVKFG